jgi:outer membrane protein assembly factor BamB
MCVGQGRDYWHAVDRFTGELRWEQPCRHPHNAHPVIDGDYIYLFDGDSLYCLNLQDGTTLWSLFTDSHYTTPVPTVDDNYVYVKVDQKLKVLDKNDGYLQWEKEHASGSLVTDQQYVYCYISHAVKALHKDDGAEQWTYDSGDAYIDHHNNIFAITNEYLCFSASYSGSEPKHASLNVLDKASGTYLWHVDFDTMYISPPTIANGVVYVVHHKDYDAGIKELHGFDLETGEQVFFDDSEYYLSQPIVANHTLFVPALGKVKAFSNQPVATEIQHLDVTKPDRYRLEQNYPNPFNPSTTITYSLTRTAFVKLTVRNLTGQTVRVLVDGTLPLGVHRYDWDGCDSNGNRMPSGVYFCHLQVGGRAESRKMLMLR